MKRTRSELEKEFDLTKNLYFITKDPEKVKQYRHKLNVLFNRLYPELK